MTNAKTNKIDSTPLPPTLSITRKPSVDKKEENAAHLEKPASFIFVSIISSLLTALIILGLSIVSIKFWRPILFPEFNTVHVLEKEIISLNQEILTLQGIVTNNENLKNELQSLKQEIEKTTTNIKTEIADVNDKVKIVASEQKKMDFEHNILKSMQEMDKTLGDANRESMDVEGKIFYTQFLTAIDDKKPLLKFYEQANKLPLSDKFKSLIDDVRGISFDTIKSREKLLHEFQQIHRDLLKESMIDSQSTDSNLNMLDRIKDNVHVTKSAKSNRTQLKNTLKTAEQLLIQGALDSTIETLKPYTHLQKINTWIHDATERLAHDISIQNLTNFKGPYSK